jgi:hypothetical protein
MRERAGVERAGAEPVGAAAAAAACFRTAGSDAWLLTTGTAAARGRFSRTTATRGERDSIWTCGLSETLPPSDVGQLSKPKVPGITVSGTTSAATSTTAAGTLAMKALAILICRVSAALAQALIPRQMSDFP